TAVGVGVGSPGKGRGKGKEVIAEGDGLPGSAAHRSGRLRLAPVRPGSGPAGRARVEQQPESRASGGGVPFFFWVATCVAIGAGVGYLAPWDGGVPLQQGQSADRLIT